MKKRVLIVDDFEYNIAFEEKVIISLMEENKVHIEVDMALTVSEALQKIEENREYDAMVIDMNLPDGSGSDIAKAALNKSEETRIAALTLYPEVYQEHKALFDMFLRKPIIPRDYKKKFTYLLDLP